MAGLASLRRTVAGATAARAYSFGGGTPFGSRRPQLSSACFIGSVGDARWSASALPTKLSTLARTGLASLPRARAPFPYACSLLSSAGPAAPP